MCIGTWYAWFIPHHPSNLPRKTILFLYVLLHFGWTVAKFIPRHRLSLNRKRQQYLCVETEQKEYSVLFFLSFTTKYNDIPFSLLECTRDRIIQIELKKMDVYIHKKNLLKAINTWIYACLLNVQLLLSVHVWCMLTNP